MYIQCTKKMSDKMGLKKMEQIRPDDGRKEADSFYSWHVNYITVNRRKVIVCMNNRTRYPVVLYRPTIKDITQLGDRIREGICRAFLEEGVPEKIVEKYIRNCGAVQYTKTAGPRAVANLNKICESVSYYVEYLDEESVIQNRISLLLAQSAAKYGNRLSNPSEELFRELCRMENIPEENWETLPEIENYQLKIRLMLEHYDIWRRILIPSRCTFQQLHKVIQKVFDWFDCHLHEFSVPDGQTKIRIADSRNPDGEDCMQTVPYELRYDAATSLREVFRSADRCIYHYDFGDNWEHEIILEKIVKDSENRFPMLLDQRGERPPENVGGEGGFEEYMRIILNPASPEYESVIQWAKLTKARERTMEEINMMLKYTM